VAGAASLTEICREPRTLELLEVAIDELVQLTSGARRRLGTQSAEGPPTSGHGISTLALALERALQDDERISLELALETLSDSLRVELAPPFALAVMRVLNPVLKKPQSSPHAEPKPAVIAVEERPLPAWLPPSRTLGGFYVQRALGAGAGGSVFVVKRSDERNDPQATALALKVPEYDGSAARSLSEEEFLRMFRQEAGAMLAVPSHPNLASFVTFDAGAKPKPILVMELVEGGTLERRIAKGDLDVQRALGLIDGMLLGLEAMHSVGVGHLDVKPSNVILREGARGSEPVLVDFGLSGRHVRPGCATGPYGAPEIWGLLPEGVIPAPMAADVYALGCVAYEVMLGRALFEASSEMAMIAAHISHDGEPPLVQQLSAKTTTRPFAEWLMRCLRQDPRQRGSVTELRQGLRQVGLALSGLSWPL
jgi:serine/threonine protein kinase